jgi:sugar phosphate isomerase/epimerase
MQRRTMVQLMGAAAAGTLLPGLAQYRPAGPVPPPGIQLYTVREALQADPVGTLERLAGLGYREVEFAGYFDHEPAQLRDALDRLDLAAPSAHVSLEALEADLAAVTTPARIHGHDWLVVPWLDASLRDPSGWRDLIGRFNRIGRRIREAGFHFGYHNHEFELAAPGGASEALFDALLHGTDPDLVSFQLDIYWAVKGGRDPVSLLRDAPGRFPMVHVKDSAGPPDHRMVDVGRGTIDFAAIFAAAGGRLRHAFLEHDEPCDAWAFARQGMTWYHSQRSPA